MKGSKIKCYAGASIGNKPQSLQEKTCDEGVTQCTKASASGMGGKY